MSIEYAKIQKANIREQDGTPGGTTYFVVLPNDNVESPICFRRIKSDLSQRCTNSAGYGTWHLGTGACKYHGGSTSDNLSANIKNGRTATVTRERLASAIQTYLSMDRASLLDMTYELAATKAIYDELLSVFPEPVVIDSYIKDLEFMVKEENSVDLKASIKLFEIKFSEYSDAFLKMQQLVGTLGNLAEKMSRIENRNTLTAAQVLYLRATVADILMKYIENPFDRDRAAKELASRMGGEVQDTVEMQNSEYYSGTGENG